MITAGFGEFLAKILAFSLFEDLGVRMRRHLQILAVKSEKSVRGSVYPARSFSSASI